MAYGIRPAKALRDDIIAIIVIIAIIYSPRLLVYFNTSQHQRMFDHVLEQAGHCYPGSNSRGK